VASWASLFQNKEENDILGRSKIGHYSCTKLLRKMELAEQDSEDEIERMVEEELVTLHADWCKKIEKLEYSQCLLENLYVIPESEMQSDNVGDGVDKQMQNKLQRGTKKKWGHVLVEKRPSRRPHDGKSILKIAQERKKRSNLEGP
jgi:hypothetical protein